MLSLVAVQPPVPSALDSILNSLRLGLIHGWPLTGTFTRKRARAPQAAEIASILVVQLGDIGDLVLTSVFLHELRLRFPQAHITLVAAAHTAPLARCCPDVNAVEIFDYRTLAQNDWLPRHSGCRSWWKGARQLAKTCFQKPPHLAFSVRQDADPIQLVSHIILATSRARWKIGYAHDSRPAQPLASRLLDVAVPREIQGHEVERHLHLLRVAGWPASPNASLQDWTTPQAEAETEEVLHSLNPSPGQRRIGIHVEAGHPLKRWPLEFFAEVARWLEKEKNCQLFFLGTESDRENVSRVLQMADLGQAVNLAGKLPLPVTASLMRHLHGFLGNDSGPFHLAVAANIPSIGIYGPADPARYGPWKGRSLALTKNTPCSPCPLHCSFSTNHCLQDLSPATVKEACQSFLWSE